MTASAAPLPRRFTPKGPLRGRIRVPGDKSISHRAIMLGALAVGETRVAGLLEGEDVLATAAAMRQLGAKIERQADGTWIVAGVGCGSLLQPSGALDMGNSGTSTRLLMGLVSSHPLTCCFVGDASLSKRPMGRVIEPLGQMGADFTAYPGGRLPLIVRGAAPAVPISYRLPVASAQVKSALLLAGLNTAGVTTVIEPVPTRDHSERMLAGFGAKLDIAHEDGARVIRLTGEADLTAQTIVVPGDPSSAAFFVVAALVVPGSDLVIENVGLNPTRAALFDVLRAMGGAIDETNPRLVGGEPVADLHVRASALHGVTVDPAVVPAMVDEFPVLFVAAALAEGRTVTSGLDELRVKESDRIAAMHAALTLAGAHAHETADGLIIDGSGGRQLRGTGDAAVTTQLDHRIAMAMAVAGLASETGVLVDDTRPIATSFPVFEALLAATGAA